MSIRQGQCVPRKVAGLMMTLLVICSGCSKRGTVGHTTEQYTHVELRRFAVFVDSRTGGDGRPLPAGGIAALETWLDEQCEEESVAEFVRISFIETPGAIVRVTQDGRRKLRDDWGRPLVYRFPSGGDGRAFRLYSTGPNGVDEDGNGDDIAAR